MTSPPLRVFGGVVAVGADGAVDLGGPKQRTVLAALLLEPGVVVPYGRLVDTLWGDDPPSRAEASIRGYLSNLRKALARVGFEAAEVIKFRDQGYALDVPPDAVDMHRFEDDVAAAVSAARLGEWHQARRDALAALGFWTGPPFGSAADEPAIRDVVVRLEQRRGDAVETLAAARLELGEATQVAAELAGEIASDPYRERLRALHATALYRSGRPVDALRALDEARRILAEDIGVEPGPELRSLEAAILAHDESLAAPTGSSPGPASSRAALDATRPALYGRGTEIDRVRSMLERLGDGGRCLVVSGEAGIGKTTLVQALRSEAIGGGLLVGWGRCAESAAAAPYRSWRDAIRPLSKVTDALDRALDATVEQQQGDQLAARLATHLAVVDALRAVPPCVLVIEDLQWADDATLALLEFIGPELEELPVLLAVTVRRTGPTDLPAPVRDALAELVRTTDVTQLALEGLGHGSVAAWVDARSGGRASDAVSTALMRTTDGNPFYLRELMALLESEGRLHDGWPDHDPTDLAATVPVAVQDVVRRRTSRMPPETQALLMVAAVVGRRFDLDVLGEVAELDREDVLDRLEPALAMGLVEPDDTRSARFAFSHALVAETLVSEQNAVRLARLHARITRVIERLRADELDVHLEDLAVHACAGASAGTADRAVELSIAAADVAHAAKDPGDEAAFLERAVTALAISGERGPTPRIRILTRLGSARRDAGDLSGGRAALLDAAVLAESVGDDDAVAEAIDRLNADDLWPGLDWSLFDQRLVALLERVLDRSTTASPRTRAVLEAALAGELVYLDPERSRRISAASVDLAEEAGEPLALARVLLQRHWGISGSSMNGARAALGARLIFLVGTGALPDRFAPLAHLSRVSAAYEVGDMDIVDRCLRNARDTAHPVRTPTGWAHLQYLETSLAALRGDLDRAAELTDALAESISRVRRFVAGSIRGVNLAMIRTEQGRIDDAMTEMALLERSQYAPSVYWLKAWMLTVGGRDEAARAALAEFDGGLPDDWYRVPITCAGVLAAAHLGDTAFLRRHVEILEPAIDRFACLGAGGPVLGPVAYALAAASAALGDDDGAVQRVAIAGEMAHRMGAACWIPRIERLATTLGA